MNWPVTKFLDLVKTLVVARQKEEAMRRMNREDILVVGDRLEPKPLM